MKLSSRNTPNLSTYVSTGSKIIYRKANSTSSGASDQQTYLTIVLNTIGHPIIAKMRSTLLQYNSLASKAKFLNQVICKGVLIPPPGSRYPKVTPRSKVIRRPVSSNGFYVGTNILHANIYSFSLATYNLAHTNLQVI